MTAVVENTVMHDCTYILWRLWICELYNVTFALHIMSCDIRVLTNLQPADRSCSRPPAAKCWFYH